MKRKTRILEAGVKAIVNQMLNDDCTLTMLRKVHGKIKRKQMARRARDTYVAELLVLDRYNAFLA